MAEYWNNETCRGYISIDRVNDDWKFSIRGRVGFSPPNHKSYLATSKFSNPLISFILPQSISYHFFFTNF